MQAVARPAATPSATLTSAASTPSPPPTNALSGRPGKNGPVLVVKLDNTGNSHPHAGLSMADVVYLEEVEWGLTRYVAVFSSKIPKTIGPIRSARIADLELLPQYGKVAFAFSGENQRLGPVIAQAPLYNVSAEVSGDGYWRQSGRPAPYDLFAHGEALLKRAPQGGPCPQHRFGVRDRSARAAARRCGSSRRSGRTPPRRSPGRGRRKALAAHDGRRPRTCGRGPTPRRHHRDRPVLQGLRQRLRRQVRRRHADDRHGGHAARRWSSGTAGCTGSPGSGPSKDSGTHWLFHGHDLPLAPGQVWILLENKDRPITTG